MPQSRTKWRLVESDDVESLEEAEFTRFTNKLPVPTSITVMRNTYACISNMSDIDLLDTRIDCNI